MPKNTVSDLITDQEIAFAHLILSGTMNDRRAAEAVGLNPETAAYTKAKPRVRAYMLEHRAAVREKLVDQEAEGLRKLNIGRDQILTRLWELATLSHEATRGTIAGQIKALSMIVAIEGLVPSGMNARRFSPPAAQPAAPPVEPDIPDWLRKQQHESATEEPGNPVASTKTQPAAPQVPHPEPAPKSTAEPAPKSAVGSSFPNFDPKPTSPFNPFIKPQAQNRVPTATGLTFDAVLDRVNPIRLSFSPDGRFSGRRR
ncbi:MAG: hypothetical protein QOJ51_3702 [Acidobacteriaceae bacterium]|jgi:hypothetical protein|nr:hypothetical protein [Acidobacteriaceae bacterium]MEA2260877.1 hypothetical protein [Acidobacteriaceae bacterium]